VFIITFSILFLSEKTAGLKYLIVAHRYLKDKKEK